MREKLYKFFRKNGFYFILFICVCLIAIAAVIGSENNLMDISDKGEKEEEDLIILENEFEEGKLGDDSIEIAKIENNEPEDFEEMGKTKSQDNQLEDDNKEEQANENNNSETSISTLAEKDTDSMIPPVEGTIITEYTEDNLIYSETLDEWTSHKGVDIMAPEGTEVVAALSGKVEEVYEDPLWGIVIIISHGDNLLTKYANLSEEEIVEEGSKVNKGDVIGKVGRSAAIEMMMDSHIHFEVIKDGVSVNPNSYLPSFIYSK